MKSSQINGRRNFIEGWYIDENLCDSILELCKGKNRYKFNSSVKSSHQGYLCAPLKILSENLHNQYIDNLNKCISLYIKEYDFLKEISEFEIPENFVQVQIYDPNYFYKTLHCENDGTPKFLNRTMVFMTYLNSIDDGGGTNFPYQNLSLKAEKGLTVIWPTYWTHPHVGVVTNAERKYILTGWITWKRLTTEA